MKLKLSVFWLVGVVVHNQCSAMEHVKQEIKDLVLNEVTVDSDQKPSTTRLIYETFLEHTASVNNKKGLMGSPRQTIQPIQDQLDTCIASLQETDPEKYQLIMNFKKKAEANGKTPQDIENFIRNNLDQLAPIKGEMYEHLYNAHVEKIEADKKKDYELHQVLDKNGAVDKTTLLHALFYRSASMPSEQAKVEKEVEKSKPCVDKWLAKVQKTDPESHAILTQALEHAQTNNLTQHDAAPHLVAAVNKLKNIESLQALLKNVQAKSNLSQTKKIAGGIIALIGTIFTVITGSTGSVLGGLFGAKNTTVVAACTLRICLELMNVTIPAP